MNTRQTDRVVHALDSFRIERTERLESRDDGKGHYSIRFYSFFKL